MLAAKMKRLRDTFERWTRGDPYPTPEAWLMFRQDLKDMAFEVAMLELGVDLTVVDIAVEAAKADGKVVVLQPRPKLTLVHGGDAS
jgi:hypothetical protein